MNPVFTIFLGNAKTMYLKAVNSGCNGDPLDLTSCTEIDIALPYADGTIKHLLLSDDEVEITTPPVLGKFSAPIADDVSALLLVGELQSFDVTFTILGETFTVRYPQALSVFNLR